MSLTSLLFYVFFGISLILYYTAACRFQWVFLLLCSVLFCAAGVLPFTESFRISGTFRMPGAPAFSVAMLLPTAFMLLSALVTWGLAALIEKEHERGQQGAAKAVLSIGIVILAGTLLVLRGKTELAPIGLSFYTFMQLSYLIDVFWKTREAEKNPLKVMLYTSYFPQLTSGPISRFSIMEQLTARHHFDWQNVTFGLQRFLWGVFKKLVVSARLAVIVNRIYGDVEKYRGFYIWIAAALFMMQLYTDFSGCMDIVLGASECYGIMLPENFRAPFLSHSVQEYWQRWHITLGEWARDYILYPVMRLPFFRGMRKALAKVLPKKIAKKIPSYLAMLPVWLFVGLWHGGGPKYVLGMGLWFWGCIVLGDLIPLPKIPVLDQIRVFILVAVGNMFFRLSSIPEVFAALRSGFSRWNPKIFINGKLFKLGLSQRAFWLTMAALLIVLLVSALGYKESVRARIARLNIVIRWVIYVLLIWSIVVFGMYGPGYDASAFIYEQF